MIFLNYVFSTLNKQVGCEILIGIRLFVEYLRVIWANIGYKQLANLHGVSVTVNNRKFSYINIYYALSLCQILEQRKCLLY